jgi:hypothetical protein
VHVDDRDPVVARLASLRPIHDRLELRDRRDLQAEVVHCRRPQVRITGQEVYELRERSRVEDQRIAGLPGVVAFGPAEHVTVEVEELGAAVVVEERGVHRDRNVVQPRRKRLAHVFRSRRQVAGPLGPRSLLGASFGVPGEKLCFSWG